MSSDGGHCLLELATDLDAALIKLKRSDLNDLANSYVAGCQKWRQGRPSLWQTEQRSRRDQNEQDGCRIHSTALSGTREFMAAKDE